ncbi:MULTISPECIES: HPP family protein [unclassified Ensifer]|uniref:HPP family protein n=1 Tax=unclassified Ensifer TaxID=2633371 RepID=UPI000813B84C|nr:MULTISPECIES: HPP family protein [unclassified Ensifer]OCP25156.1 hypothetical protein BC361_19040 [Ensifer sp. LC54]OCP25511.1 hypothetical protein BC363_20110 [Ensifer sp. LC384]
MVDSPNIVPPARPPRRFFVPILAGATLRERLLGCLGALVGILLTGMISGSFFGAGASLPLIVAPMGASAVLLFAVPASPLAQPWSIIGGNTISAFIGVLSAMLIPDPLVATGIGVALAIAAMSFARCLHPPGGAAALTAVLGGPVVANWGLWFPLVPVALNSCLLVALGVLFHKLARRNYPHVAAPVSNAHQTVDPPSDRRVGFTSADVDAALEALEETFDISRDDLDRLLRQVELQAAIRATPNILCRDIMSRDVISVRDEDNSDLARSLLLKHNVRILPVKDGDDRLVGTVGLRELSQAGTTLSNSLAVPVTAGPQDRAMSLLPALTSGRIHAVIIVDENSHVLGLISQTDLLAATARAIFESRVADEDAA